MDTGSFLFSDIECAVKYNFIWLPLQSHAHFLNSFLTKANVGFDARGVLKLFDFGFAVSIEEDNPKALYDRCGTLR